jgi:uncharacterized protein YegL
MLSRRSLMALSFLVSGVFYVCFLMAAPHILLINAEAAKPKALQTFRVELKNIPVQAVDPATESEEKTGEPAAGQPEGQPQSGNGTDLSSRPGTMAELLTRPDDQSIGAQAFQVANSEIPNIADRVSTDAVPREHDLSYSETGAKHADAKIIEIARDTARLDINIPRRFVRPSPDRIVEPGTFPVLRSEAIEPGQIPMEIDRRGISLLGQPVAMPVASTGAGPAAPGSLVASTPPPEPPPMPKEVVKSLEKPMAEAAVQKEVKAVRAESDFFFLDDLVDIKMTTYRAAGDKQGFFELSIQPKEGGKIDVLPKDVTFVIDASRSMQQRKLDLAAKGVGDMVRSLRPEDRFNVVVFRDSPTFLHPNRVAADEGNKASAAAFLKGLESKGQTDVYSALRPVVAQQPRAGIPGIIVLVTDGRPTAGLQDSREVINAVTGENGLRNSIFAFGAGNTVNRYLLDLIAYRNIGRCAVIANMEETAAKLPGFFEEFSDPLLTDIKVDYGRIADDEIYPRAIPNFYRRGAVKVYGRFDPEKDKEFVMRLSGRAGGREKELVFRAKLGEAGQATGTIASEWAFSKAYYIIGEMSRQGETPELVGQLKELSSKYNIRTIYNQQ